MPRWRAPSALALALAVACALAPRSSAFYLPGVAPQDYERDDLVTIKVRNLDSIKTQLPFDYYDLPYCRPPKIEHSAENLGEVLRGDRIENSPYTLEMRLDEQCKVVCTIDALNADLPYDQFLLEQLAGDELEKPTSQSMIATGYHRLMQWDDEPADRLLHLFDNLDDDLRITTEGMLGMTVGCAWCHGLCMVQAQCMHHARAVQAWHALLA